MSFFILRLSTPLTELRGKLSRTKIPNLRSDVVSEFPTGLKAVESEINFFADSEGGGDIIEDAFICALVSVK